MTDIEVRVRDCTCPGEPHPEGDVVYMRPTLPLAGGLEAEHDYSQALAAVIAEAGPKPIGGWSEEVREQMSRDVSERLRRRWLATYVRYGAIGWNFLDDDGDPVPFDVDAILDDYGLAQPVAEKGDELYGETVTRPLVARQATLSQRGRNSDSTSPRKPRTKPQSRRSSPAISAGTRRSAA